MASKNKKRYALSLDVDEWTSIFRILRRITTPHPVDDELLADRMEKELVEQLPEGEARRFQR